LVFEHLRNFHIFILIILPSENEELEFLTELVGDFPWRNEGTLPRSQGKFNGETMLGFRFPKL